MVERLVWDQKAARSNRVALIEMASICSIHQELDPDCDLCKVDLSDDPLFQQMHAEAEAAGTHVCEECEFLYYKTVDSCPLCGHRRI